MRGWRRIFGRGAAGEPPATPDEARAEQLSAYLDDELSPSERAEVEAALAGDAELRDRLEDLRAVRVALRSLAAVRAPRSFALTAPPVQRRGMPRLELATRVATAAVAAAFVVALVLPGGGRSETVTSAPAGGFGAASKAAAPATATPGMRTFAAPAPQLATPPAAAPTGSASRAATLAASTASTAPTAPEAATATPAGPEARAGLAPRATPGTANDAAGATQALQAPTEAPLPANVASPQSPDHGERRLITVGLGALTVLLAALSAGEWIVRRARS